MTWRCCVTAEWANCSPGLGPLHVGVVPAQVHLRACPSTRRSRIPLPGRVGRAELAARHTPRIPLAVDVNDFQTFVDAGKQLMDLHINYETVEPYPLQEQVTPAAGMDDYELFSVGPR